MVEGQPGEADATAPPQHSLRSSSDRNPQRLTNAKWHNKATACRADTPTEKRISRCEIALLRRVSANSRAKWHGQREFILLVG